MIRSTKNEGISSASKQRVTALSTGAYSGIVGEGIELVEDTTGVIEGADNVDRTATQSDTPSDGFNGTFE